MCIRDRSLVGLIILIYDCHKLFLWSPKNRQEGTSLSFLFQARSPSSVPALGRAIWLKLKSILSYWYKIFCNNYFKRNWVGLFLIHTQYLLVKITWYEGINKRYLWFSKLSAINMHYLFIFLICVRLCAKGLSVSHSFFSNFFFNFFNYALAGVAQWIEHQSKAKGQWFDFQSGHMPEFRGRSPVGGAWEATTH